MSESRGDQHWHVQLGDETIVDAAWNLTTPMDDALKIARWFSFYLEKLTVEIDGEQQRF